MAIMRLPTRTTGRFSAFRSGGDDTLTQVELTFPTREAAVAYAQRQGLAYIVEERCTGGVSQSSHDAWKDDPQQSQAFKDIVASYL
jgi:ETC complex I subunit conserved region